MPWKKDHMPATIEVSFHRRARVVPRPRTHLMLMDEKEKEQRMPCAGRYSRIIGAKWIQNKKDRPACYWPVDSGPLIGPKKIDIQWGLARMAGGLFFRLRVLMPEWSVRKEFVKRFGAQGDSSTRGRWCQKNCIWSRKRKGLYPMGVFEKSMNQVFEVSVMAMAIRPNGSKA